MASSAKKYRELALGAWLGHSLSNNATQPPENGGGLRIDSQAVLGILNAETTIDLSWNRLH